LGSLVEGFVETGGAAVRGWVGAESAGAFVDEDFSFVVCVTRVGVLGEVAAPVLLELGDGDGGGVCGVAAVAGGGDGGGCVSHCGVVVVGGCARVFG